MPPPANVQAKPAANTLSSYSSSQNMRNVSPKPLNNYVSNSKNFEAFDFFGQEIAKTSQNNTKTPTKIN